MDQARQSLATGNRSVLIVSPAGSGKSVIIAEIARLAAEKGGHILFTVHRKELINQIKETFNQAGIPDQQTTIMTVGKIKNRLEQLPKPSLIITDETHHSLAKTYQKIYQFWDTVPRLGFTATPWRLSGEGLGRTYDDMVVGPQVQWLIDYHRLAPIKVFGAELGDQSVLRKSSTGDFTGSSLAEFEKTIDGGIVESWQKFAGNRKTIVYCSTVAFSKKVAEMFNQAGVPAAEADAKTPAKQREQVMSDFKSGKIQVLTNCDLISEGFNVPDCSCVVLLRPTKSLVLYIQQSMRCMRYQPGKQAVIIDQVRNFERFGLPTDNRHWTLKDRKKGKNTDNGPAVKTCPKCLLVMLSTERMCPNCGYVIQVEKTEREGPTENKTQKLTEIKPFKVSYLLGKNPAELTTMDELKEYAKGKGYKPGWVYYQAKQRGWIH